MESDRYDTEKCVATSLKLKRNSNDYLRVENTESIYFVCIYRKFVCDKAMTWEEAQSHT